MPHPALASSRATTRLLVLLLALPVLALGVGAAWHGPQAPPRPSETARAETSPDGEVGDQQPRAVLRRWDERRARAWADGDVAALRRLYVAGSRAGGRDVAMLRRWLDRGLRVRGMRVQVLTARVVRRDDRRLVLDVTDRLAHATATGRGRARALPTDRATPRRITLRRAGGGRWRVAAVRRADGGSG